MTTKTDKTYKITLKKDVNYQFNADYFTDSHFILNHDNTLKYVKLTIPAMIKALKAKQIARQYYESSFTNPDTIELPPMEKLFKDTTKAFNTKKHTRIDYAVNYDNYCDLWESVINKQSCFIRKDYSKWLRLNNFMVFMISDKKPLQLLKDGRVIGYLMPCFPER